MVLKETSGRLLNGDDATKVYRFLIQTNRMKAGEIRTAFFSACRNHFDFCCPRIVDKDIETTQLRGLVGCTKFQLTTESMGV